LFKFQSFETPIDIHNMQLDKDGLAFGLANYFVS